MDSRKIERISKALGDQTRLRIFEVIAAQKNLTCSELVKLQGVTPATISHHLKILTDAELIECRKEGQFVFSRTVPATIPCILQSSPAPCDYIRIALLYGTRSVLHPSGFSGGVRSSPASLPAA